MGLFLRLLHDIPEFTDEDLHLRISACREDLLCWASVLRDYRGNFRAAAVQRRINDLSEEVGEHVRIIRESLHAFRESGMCPNIHLSTEGIKNIKLAQTQAQTGFQNLSTVATFFSAMTASTLQFSWEPKE
ncbi:hypothetical protein FRC02_010284 [Tulasnella sp. 418]|nr:hypothetical protein FRC02_010284 [Tulasnella sp. 418]